MEAGGIISAKTTIISAITGNFLPTGGWGACRRHIATPQNTAARLSPRSDHGRGCGDLSTRSTDYHSPPICPNQYGKENQNTTAGGGGENGRKPHPHPFKDENGSPRLRNYAHACATRLGAAVGFARLRPFAPACAPVAGFGWGLRWLRLGLCGLVCRRRLRQGLRCSVMGCRFLLFSPPLFSPPPPAVVFWGLCPTPLAGLFLFLVKRTPVRFQQGFPHGRSSRYNRNNSNKTKTRRGKGETLPPPPPPSFVQPAAPPLALVLLRGSAAFASSPPPVPLLLASAGGFAGFGCLVRLGLSAAAGWLVRAPCPPLVGGE